MAENASDILVETIIKWGVDTVFGIPGDGVNGVIETLRVRQDRVRFIQVRHEEAAAFMACGYAKYTGRLGCCLARAHAELLKLVRSLNNGKPFDTPAQPLVRYRSGRADSPFVPWRFTLQSLALPAGKRLRIETRAPAKIRWSGDEWTTCADAWTRDAGIGLFIVDLPTDTLPAGSTIRFTFHWPDSGTWEGRDFAVSVTGPDR